MLRSESKPLTTARGLYDPANEHDGCGVACVARLDGVPSRETLERGIGALVNMEHRGAAGADASTGDGAGILMQLPDALLRAVAPEGAELPPLGRYAVAMCFLPPEADRRQRVERLVERTVEAEGQRVIGWRDVPVEPAHIGERAREVAPCVRQLFVAAGPDVADQDAFERRLYVIRRLAEQEAGADLAVPSFSSRTVVYKGMLSAPQLARFYTDLRDERAASALAIVHSRFSTNTFPTWALAHPYRMIAHNGEINTLRGNVNWMRARERSLASELFGRDLERIVPVVVPGGSDSSIFDNVLEFLVLAGFSPPHALMAMMPEAWEGGRDDLSDEVKGFYAYHAAVMEPWDGPASITFSDGRMVGARLDRNGLRPGRWAVTDDGWVALASEAGAFELDPERVTRRGRLRPGQLFVVDLECGRVLTDGEGEREIAARRPYTRWYAERAAPIELLPDPAPPATDGAADAARDAAPAEPPATLRLAFGYTQEDLRTLLAPMALTGKEPDGSMGNDAALAVLSDRQPPLFSYFKQLFAQVTNPAIDPVREDVVMSLRTTLGPSGNLLEASPEHAAQIVMDRPIILRDELEKLRRISHPDFSAATIDITWPVSEGAEGLEPALEGLCARACGAIAEGANLLVLSDRRMGPERIAVPSLLATAALHHHLVREGLRLRAALIVDSGEPREVHHFACLIAYGANAVHPYLMLDSLPELIERGDLPADTEPDEAEGAVLKALGKGLLKVMSKMGISTIESYRGAQILEAVGLDRELIDRHFTGTASRIGGVGLDVLAREALERHARAYPGSPEAQLPVGGIYAWRRDGEHHLWNPDTVRLLQESVRSDEDGAATYERYAQAVNDESRRRATLRGLMSFRPDRDPVALEDVEPASEIVKRFATGAMSLGAISPESHEALAIAMNRIGGQSNTGEGGEDPRRNVPDPNGDSRRSAIKQVASARFGVTLEYLVNADELQIKICQGSKPGEGGQLPGHKVDDYIANLRLSTPGVELISPPPHHDIYSIEDLKQLIYDLRCSNPRARISVKLAAEVGVGTVAAGVAKAGSDHIVIAGFEGGTGSSPLSSIQSAGVPWELGLAETQQTLVLNDLRSRVIVQVDGQMKTGRDVVVAGLLGAEEMGFSTAPLIATGCIMMRVCHLNTCPVGIATQDPELRRRFEGTPEHVIRYFFHVAEEARALMASLGITRFDDLVGRCDLLARAEAIDHWKARGVDLSELLAVPGVAPDAPRRRTRSQDSTLEGALDWELIGAARPALDHGEGVTLRRRVRNVNRTVGGLLSNAVLLAHGAEGLPEGTIQVGFDGSAGQSFGAWLAPGVSFYLRGEANDYAGKGLAGGILAVCPPEQAPYRAEENVIVGNTVLYGATAGRAFFRGLAGERFCVRNSGAWAVVEGVGDHGCEYMTGGRVVVLGPTGRNFAAGMSGGVAYVLDEDRTFAHRCNRDLVDFDELDEEDLRVLHDLVAEHAARTGSPVAEGVLADWEDALGRFVKVMPRDFKRVLERLAAEQGGAGGAARAAAGHGDGSPAAGDVRRADRAMDEDVRPEVTA